jgi:hypothetical protein
MEASASLGARVKKSALAGRFEFAFGINLDDGPVAQSLADFSSLTVVRAARRMTRERAAPSKTWE